jgi:L-seryl-tRNA(Ser) seleniumtransferase
MRSRPTSAVATSDQSAQARPRPPSIERLIVAAASELADDLDHAAVVAAARQVTAAERTRLDAGESAHPLAALAAELVDELGGYVHGGATTVINATGVIIHTNLGRAPWAAAAIEAARAAAEEPLLLELDRSSGRRGARFRVAEEHLIALTGAEDALVTNNNAAAVALAVGLAGRRGGVAVSRGELVEIGGGVRIPEIVRRAGVRLIEVGTTNRTRVADFEAPLTDGSARMVLRVHPSNFVQEGFVEAPDPVGLADLAHRFGALVIDDLGSGALLPTERFGLAHEPMPDERLAAGSDLVTFSGDKLVGGPQAGLIVGRADLIARIRRDPFARAMRPDKTTLAALAATLGLYRAGRAVAEIPVWQMIAQQPDDLRARAEAIAAELSRSVGESRISITATLATIGGGSLPGETLPSWGLGLGDGKGLEALLARLRRGDPAVIGRIADGRVVLDLRTVPPLRDGDLSIVISRALGASARG